MSEIVIDASAALAWTLRSQRTDAAFAFLARATGDDFVAPFVFPWETRNVLLRLLQRGKLTMIDYEEAVDGFNQFAVRLEDSFPATLVEPLALGQKISMFDAAYLALAVAQSFSLATRDEGLLAAAGRLGVETWDLR